MTIDEFASELVQDKNWRREELERLANLVAGAPESSRDELRRPLVVMLYAHFEGFCKFALLHYCRAVSDERANARDAHPAVVAGGLDPVFRAMQTGDKKCEHFKDCLPQDDKLHVHSRRRAFVEKYDLIAGAPLSIPPEVIDTESNLTPHVLRRNLYIVGLDYSFLDEHHGKINELIGKRNAVAHGDNTRGYSLPDYERLLHSVNAVFDAIETRLIAAFRGGHFLRRPT